MDFVADELFDGRRFRALTLVDNYSRRCLAISREQSVRGPEVASVVEQATQVAGGRLDYNSFRPHSSLGGLTPDQYIEQHSRNTLDSNFRMAELKGEGQCLLKCSNSTAGLLEIYRQLERH